MSQLASLNSKLGNLDAALVLNERALEILQTVLPEDNLHIGEWNGLLIVFCLILIHFLCLGNSMINLAITYSDLGRHEDAMALYQRVLENRRRVLPEDHHLIGV